MKLINISINKYFHMIPLWKSPIKLPVELPVEATRGTTRRSQRLTRDPEHASRASRCYAAYDK